MATRKDDNTDDLGIINIPVSDRGDLRKEWDILSRVAGKSVADRAQFFGRILKLSKGAEDQKKAFNAFLVHVLDVVPNSCGKYRRWGQLAPRATKAFWGMVQHDTAGGVLSAIAGREEEDAQRLLIRECVKEARARGKDKITKGLVEDVIAFLEEEGYDMGRTTIQGRMRDDEKFVLLLERIKKAEARAKKAEDSTNDVLGMVIDAYLDVLDTVAESDVWERTPDPSRKMVKLFSAEQKLRYDEICVKAELYESKHAAV